MLLQSRPIIRLDGTRQMRLKFVDPCCLFLAVLRDLLWGSDTGREAQRRAFEEQRKREKKMIIPVRCFTCGKVWTFLFVCLLICLKIEAFRSYRWSRMCSLMDSVWLSSLYHVKVIGNKWDQYLDLLQADYPEGWVHVHQPIAMVWFWFAVHVLLALFLKRTIFG